MKWYRLKLSIGMFVSLKAARHEETGERILFFNEEGRQVASYPAQSIIGLRVSGEDEAPPPPDADSGANPLHEHDP